jgi:hypothetical protein
VSGPGWMPSRPRPLGQVRRRLVSYAHLRRRARRARDESAVPVADVTATTCGRFVNRRAKLPVAMLLPRRTPGGSRELTGWLHRWCVQRWGWIQPRLIPLIVAFVGLIGVLNARRYLLELARGPAVVCAEPAERVMPEHHAAEPAHEATCPAPVR